jgi:hypothetical protein
MDVIEVVECLHNKREGPEFNPQSQKRHNAWLGALHFGSSICHASIYCSNSLLTRWSVLSGAKEPTQEYG